MTMSVRGVHPWRNSLFQGGMVRHEAGTQILSGVDRETGIKLRFFHQERQKV